MITNKKRVRTIMIVVTIIIFLILGGIYYLWKDSRIFVEGLDMVNIVDKAKEINKDEFINYQVQEGGTKGKELIAVHFNTDDKNNVGFIDEYGNVVKEPFLNDPYYDYYETQGGGWMSFFIGEYYEDIHSDSYYNRNFKKIELTDEEEQMFKNAESEILTREGKEVTKKDLYAIRDTVQKITGKDYKIDTRNVFYTGEIYQVYFVLGSSVYYILLDQKYSLLTKLYYFEGDENQFSAPEFGSKVGSAFVLNLGLVYYNIDGEIIWITYCKDKTIK